MPEDKTLKDIVVKYVAGQPFNNMLLIAILTMIGWLGHYALTIAIPEHLRQIQSGYETLNTSHEAERGRTLEMYDRWLSSKPPQERTPTSLASP